MAAQDRDRPLPKFGEWDVNNPASAEGFTVIFSKARDEKKTSSAGTGPTPRRNNSAANRKMNDKAKPPAKKKSWLCCGA